jgi:hypothetical protein
MACWLVAVLKACRLPRAPQTELGHGSNVMGIETTAVYEPAERCFVITTPTDEASKYWIGGSGQHGRRGTGTPPAYKGPRPPETLTLS